MNSTYIRLLLPVQNKSMGVISFENDRWSNNRQGIEFRHRAALSFIEKGSLLDVGCGDGLFLKMLGDKGVMAEGLDPSPVALERAKNEGVKVTTGNLDSKLPFPDRSFDYVSALDVLEHLYNPEQLIFEMKRVARKSVIISVPNFSSFPARLQTLIGLVPENNRPNKGHVYWFNYGNLRALIIKSGMKISLKKFNTLWETVPILGNVTKLIARLWPSAFALSFVVRCESF